MSKTQATPAVPSHPGPTDCIHCGQRIRRFGQTRRWCHDATGNVQCAHSENRLVTATPRMPRLRRSKLTANRFGVTARRTE